MHTLFIPSPYFPPSALPPSQRVRLLVRHLHAYGWKPIVFTSEPKYREEKPDPWMLEIVGDHFEQVMVSTWDQNKTRKFGIGDLGIRMFFGLLRAMRKKAKVEKPDLVLYPVPPWYIMVMAPFLKRITGIPYAIDFIDPWVFKIKHKNLKSRFSQWIARNMEGFVLKRSSAVFAVSDGILADLKSRYPWITKKPMIAVPYGVEITDFQAIQINKEEHQRVMIRYTGAISENMMPVIEVLLKAFTKINLLVPIQVIFTGTTYAGKGMVKPILSELIRDNKLGAFVEEHPARVGYKQALELGRSSDLQLLIGDTTPYYAASKMMGLVASGRPFFAFVHAGSFPASFLKELHYTDKVLFVPTELGTIQKQEELYTGLLKAIQRRSQFTPISIDHPVLSQYTANAMTKIFTDTFQKIIHEHEALR
jgi:hypothetical protein